MSETARGKHGFLTILAVVGPVALVFLAGFGVMYVSPLLDRPAPIRTAWTAEEIAALDDLYAFRILASTAHPADADIVARAQDMPETETKILDDTGKTLAAWMDVVSGFNESDLSVTESCRRRNGRLQTLVLYGPHDISGQELIRDAVFTLTVAQNQRAIAFTFTGDPSKGLSGLTAAGLPGETTPGRKLACILDGNLIFVPEIQARVVNGIVMFPQMNGPEEKRKHDAEVERILHGIAVLQKQIPKTVGK